MEHDPKLHHVAKRITAGNLENVIDLFQELDLRVTYRPEKYRWAMVGQPELHFEIQLAEVEDQPLQGSSRIGSHVGFLSSNPAAKIAQIEKWATTKGLKFEKGQWDEKQLWFDFPELFVDWVVEIMHASIING